VSWSTDIPIPLRARSLSALALLCAICALTAVRAYAFPWDIDMFRGPEVQPFAQAPRVMPPGTLPIHGEAPLSTVASIRLLNPFGPTRHALTEGRQLFETNCAPCHGTSGKGDGSVAFLLRVPPADLTAESVANMPDGFIYGTIRNGTIAMPSYGDALSPDERWNIVLAVRWLEPQKAGGGENAGGRRALPESPDDTSRVGPVMAPAVKKSAWKPASPERLGYRTQTSPASPSSAPEILAAASAGPRPASLALEAVRKKFLAFCVKCHGIFGRGDGPVAPVLERRPADFTDCSAMARLSDAKLFAAIKEGGPAVGMSAEMMAWKEGLDDGEIKSLVSYVRSFCGD
jgi:mono/diheme cytochrome c family protein